MVDLLKAFLRPNAFLIARPISLLAIAALLSSIAPLFGSGAKGEKKAESNAVIAACVKREIESGRSGGRCVGQFFRKCQQRKDVSSRQERDECMEREIVLWGQVVLGAYKRLRQALKSDEERALLAKTQELWRALRTKDCRLPYQILRDKQFAQTLGFDCSLGRTAGRALQLLKWHRAVKGP